MHRQRTRPPRPHMAFMTNCDPSFSRDVRQLSPVRQTNCSHLLRPNATLLLLSREGSILSRNVHCITKSNKQSTPTTPQTTNQRGAHCGETRQRSAGIWRRQQQQQQNHNNIATADTNAGVGFDSALQLHGAACLLRACRHHVAQLRHSVRRWCRCARRCTADRWRLRNVDCAAAGATTLGARLPRSRWRRRDVARRTARFLTICRTTASLHREPSRCVPAEKEDRSAERQNRAKTDPWYANGLENDPLEHGNRFQNAPI